MLSARLARLNRRSKTLLSVASVLVAIVVVGGGLLALDPALAARLGVSLPGTANRLIFSNYAIWSPTAAKGTCLMTTTEPIDTLQGQLRVRAASCENQVAAPKTFTAERLWSLEQVGDWFRLRPSAQGQVVCLALAEETDAVAGTAVTAVACKKATDDQLWKLENLETLPTFLGRFQNVNLYQIKPKLATELCLAAQPDTGSADGTSYPTLELASCADANRWVLTQPLK
jgi:hypothetical protein